MRAFGYVWAAGPVVDRSAQEKAISGYASRQGIEVLQIFRDEGVGGASGEAVRPGLASLLAALEDGEAEAIVIDRLDRLARDVVLQETVCARLAKRGIAVIAVSSPISGDEPNRELVRHIFAAVDQYERALNRARILAGKAIKSAAGGYVGGRPAFGWRVENGHLVQVPHEQAVIARMREMREKNMSMNGIANVLNAEGENSKMGASWSATTVRRVLRRLDRSARAAESS